MNEERAGKCWQLEHKSWLRKESGSVDKWNIVPLVNTSRSFPHSWLMVHLSTLPDPFLIHDLCSTCQHFPLLSSFTTYVPLVNTSRSFPHSQLMFHLSTLPVPFLIHDLCSTCQHFPILSSFMTYVPLVNTSRLFPHWNISNIRQTYIILDKHFRKRHVPHIFILFYNK
jgi:hypothetical protein